MVVTSILPLMLIALFVIESIYAKSLRGMICLFGLIVFLLLFRMIYAFIPKDKLQSSGGEKIPKFCKNHDILSFSFSLNDDDSAEEQPTGRDQTTSTATATTIHFPSNLFMMTFLLTYVTAFTFYNFNFKNVENILLHNILFISVSVVLLLLNCYYMYTMCTKNKYVLGSSLFLGCISGLLWSSLIESLHLKEYQYMMGITANFVNVNGTKTDQGGGGGGGSGGGGGGGGDGGDVPLCTLCDVLENKYNVQKY